MTKFEFLQKEYSGVYGTIGLYIDGTTIFYIDVDDDSIEGYRNMTARCGCCSEVIDYETKLSHEVEYMDDNDFKDLIEQLDKLK